MRLRASDLLGFGALSGAMLLCGCFDPTSVDQTDTDTDTADGTGTGSGDGMTNPTADGPDGGPGDTTDDPTDPTDPTGPGDSTGPSIDCSTDEDCEDPDPCVVGTCGADGTCQLDTVDPDDDDACTDDTCDPVTHEIVNTPIDLDDADLCTFDVCDPATGPDHQAIVLLFEETFDAGGQAGWTADAPWQIGPAVPSGVHVPQGGFRHDPGQDHTDGPDNTLAGAAIGGFLPVELGTRYFVSPAFDATVSEGSVVLSYWRWLVSDYSPFVVNTVEVYGADGTWHTVFQSNDVAVLDTGWTRITHDVTEFAGPDMQVRFGYAIGDGGVYGDVPGWSVDDIRVANVPLFVDDGDPCTDDICEPRMGAISVPTPLDDGDPCTEDSCSPYGPIHLDTSLRLVSDFASLGHGWNVGPEWQVGPAIMSADDPGMDTTPSPDNHVAGVNLGGQYAITLHPYYFLTSPGFDGTVSGAGPITLDFQRWLQSDYPNYVFNSVEVWNGTAWIQVFVGPPNVAFTDMAWTPQSFDLTPYAGPNMQVRFGFSVGQNGAVAEGGWNIDDVVIRDASCE